jgi:hypothetical protein
MPLVAAFFAPAFALPLVPAFDGALGFGFGFGFGSAETVVDREEIAGDGIETAPSPADALSGAVHAPFFSAIPKISYLAVLQLLPEDPPSSFYQGFADVPLRT